MLTDTIEQWDELLAFGNAPKQRTALQVGKLEGGSGGCFYPDSIAGGVWVKCPLWTSMFFFGVGDEIREIVGPRFEIPTRGSVVIVTVTVSRTEAIVNIYIQIYNCCHHLSRVLWPLTCLVRLNLEDIL